MSFRRVTLAAFTAAFTAGMTSLAFAGCCDWGVPAPVAYAPPPVYAGCGGCAVPIAPVTPATPVVPAPISVAAWDVGGCACGGLPLYYAAPPVVPPVAPAPFYVVNQGPAYTGPGLMVPFKTWSPAAAFAPAIGYPYVPGPRYYRPTRHWRSYPRGPLRVRG